MISDINLKPKFNVYKQIINIYNISPYILQWLLGKKI